LLSQSADAVRVTKLQTAGSLEVKALWVLIPGEVARESGMMSPANPI